ncbi:MAG TPA: RibD family protein [Bdellovibrionota bacterium]|nr:RibD family protein [Bdellovibrionota bacterium]
MEWAQFEEPTTGRLSPLGDVPEATWGFLLQMRRRLEEGVNEFHYAPQAFGFAVPAEDPYQEFLPALLRDAEDAGFAPEELTALRLYLPVVIGAHLAKRQRKVFVVAHLAQSLDGRIATRTGHSRWISNSANLMHVHRLRALVDAVLVGRGTAERDRPQLTVRHVAGRNPGRVSVSGACPGGTELFSGKGEDLCYHGGEACGLEGHRVLSQDGEVEPGALLKDLASRGWHSLLVEGGGGTVSRFISQGCWDRLQLHIAPVILGEGVPGLRLPSVDTVEQAPRVSMTAYDLDGEVLIECRRKSAWRMN